MANEEIEKWWENIKLGLDFRKTVGMESKWDTYKKYYRNEFRKDILPVNLVFPLIRSIVPRVYFRDPKVVVSARKPGMGLHARIVESADNWLVRKIRIKYEFKKMIQDGCLYGTGIGKSGFDSEYGYSFDSLTKRDLDPFEERLVELGVWEPEEEHNQIEYNENIMPGMPWFMRINPKDFVVPFGCDNLRSSPWAAHRIARQIDDARADEKYSEFRKKLVATHSIESLYNNDWRKSGKISRISGSGHIDYVILWEVYDVKTKRIKVFAEDQMNEWLRNDPDPNQIGGLPFDALTFNDDGEYFWGIPDAQYLEPQQLEMNEIRTQFQKQRKNSLMKFLVQQGAFKEEEMDKLKSGEAESVIEVNLSNLREAIFEFQPNYNDFLLVAGNTVRQDMRETVGFSRNQLGEFDQSSRRTATEAHIVNESAQLRVDERRDVAADLYMEVVRRLNKFIFANWTQDRVAQVVGPDGANYWVSYTGEQIRGDYDIDVDPDTARPISSALRKEEALQLLQVLGGLPPQMLVDPATNQLTIQFSEVIKYVIEQFETLDPTRVISPMVAPSQNQQTIPINQLSELFSRQSGGGVGNANVPISLSQMLQGIRGAS